jgi:hypothetical protein
MGSAELNPRRGWATPLGMSLAHDPSLARKLKACHLNRRGGSMQRLAAAAPVRRCYAPAERVDSTRTVATSAS